MCLNYFVSQRIMSLFNIFRTSGSRSPNQERILAYCPDIQQLAKKSVHEHLSPQADEFDYDMAIYSGIGIYLAFLYAHLKLDTASPITMKVLDWADEQGDYKLGASVTYGRLKIGYDSDGSLDKLGKDILQDLSYISPLHEAVFADVISYIESIIPNIKRG